MRNLQSIAVFCGSSPGDDELYMRTALITGRRLADRGITLVYGGAVVGLMGAVADGALAGGGTVIGVIPSFLKTKEIAHTGLTELVVVDTMHARKLKMHELSDGIISLPGGFGTMEEMFEMLTWAQLGLHKKPIGLLNISGFYNGLKALVNTMRRQGFLKQEHADMLLISDDINTLLAQMNAYVAPDAPKWIDEAGT